MKKPKIVIVGVGSVIFGLSCLKDAFTTKELWGSELVFVDIDKPALDKMVKAAHRINDEMNAGYKIVSTVKLTEALPDADFVITSIAIERARLWKEDFRVPKKYGIQHVLGENVGPSAIFHTLRNVPILLDICRNMERLCPNALLINFTNPESRICLAIEKYTNVKVVGLCHQLRRGISNIAQIMNLDDQDIDVKAWGINHFTWMMDIRKKSTGEDLYPLLREKEAGYNPDFEKLSRYLFNKFGLYPTSGDGHLGEFFPFAHEMMSTEGYDFHQYETRRRNIANLIEGLGNGSIDLTEELLSPSMEKAFTIIKGMTFNTNELIPSANIRNNGFITNLPFDAIVEVPVVVSGNGVNGIGVGALPRGIAAICTTQINVQHLVVDAAVQGSKDLALQAMLVDPNIPSAEAAESIFKELFEINRQYLPQFQ